MTEPRYIGTVSLGNILTIISLLFTVTAAGAAFAFGYGALSTVQAEQARRLDTVEASQRDREGRLRVIEATIAGQASDLRNIQTGIDEIKATLGRMTAAPAP